MGNKNPVQQPIENQSENDSCYLQIYVIGESFVGKTCLARTYETGEFEENRCLRIGVSRHIRSLRVQNINTELIIWNVSGQERYRSDVVPYFVRRAEGVLLLYDIADIRSFNVLPIFLKIMRKSNPGAIIFLIGARSDLSDKREVQRETGQLFASNENLEFFECSAKTGENVNQIFEHMALRLLQKKELIPPDKKELLVEGKSLNWNQEKELSNNSVSNEESVLHGSNTKNEICHNLQKSFPKNDSEMLFLNLEEKSETFKITELLTEAHSGNESGHELTEKDGRASSQSCIQKQSEENKDCHPSNDKKDAQEKAVLLSEEEMLVEGKCPVGFY